MTPPTPYPYVQYVPVPVVAQPRNGLATAALVLGLCTFISFGATGIPAVVCGILGYRESRKHGVGEGTSIVGLVFGGLAVLGWLGFWFLAIIGNAMTPTR